jgi:hypothetical protein
MGMQEDIVSTVTEAPASICSRPRRLPTALAGLFATSVTL